MACSLLLAALLQPSSLRCAPPAARRRAIAMLRDRGQVKPGQLVALVQVRDGAAAGGWPGRGCCPLAGGGAIAGCSVQHRA